VIARIDGFRVGREARPGGAGQEPDEARAFEGGVSLRLARVDRQQVEDGRGDVDRPDHVADLAAPHRVVGRAEDEGNPRRPLVDEEAVAGFAVLAETLAVVSRTTCSSPR